MTMPAFLCTEMEETARLPITTLLDLKPLPLPGHGQDVWCVCDFGEAWPQCG